MFFNTISIAVISFILKSLRGGECSLLEGNKGFTFKVPRAEFSAGKTRINVNQPDGLPSIGLSQPELSNYVAANSLYNLLPCNPLLITSQLYDRPPSNSALIGLELNSYPPSYGQSSYETSSYGQLGYGTSSYGPLGYGTSNIRPLSYGLSSYGTSSYGIPSYGPSSYGIPNNGASSYRPPSFNAQNYELPGYQMPNYELPYKYEHIPSSESEIVSSILPGSFPGNMFKTLNDETTKTKSVGSLAEETEEFLDSKMTNLGGGTQMSNNILHKSGIFEENKYYQLFDNIYNNYVKTVNGNPKN